MAQKRMFSLSVTDTDKFLDMPSSAQALYFHLGLHGDDDGFVAAPKKIARSVGCNDDDLRLLAAKGYIIPFESGVVVIADWHINNTLKNDRYHPTIFSTEREMIFEDSNGRWTFDSSLDPERKQAVSALETEHNLTKQSLTEKNGDKAATPPRSRFIPPSLEEVQAYCSERQNSVNAAHFLDYYATNGWVQGKGKPIKDWKACVRTWERQSYGGEQSAAVPKPRQFDAATNTWR